MNILPLLIFVSLLLAAMGVLLFVFSVRNEDFDHDLQLSLKPLEEEKPR